MFELEKKELNSYQLYNMKVKSLEIKLCQLRASIESVKTMNLNEHISGGLPVTIEQKISELIDLESEWASALAESERKCSIIKKAIEENVESVNQLAGIVLLFHFINGYTFEKIAVALNSGYRTIIRYYNKGLKIYSKSKNGIDWHSYDEL